MTNVVRSPWFDTSVLILNGTTKWNGHTGSFSIFIIAEGEATMETDTGSTQMKMGDVWLIPAEIVEAKLFSGTRCRIIETFMP